LCFTIAAPAADINRRFEQFNCGFSAVECFLRRGSWKRFQFCCFLTLGSVLQVRGSPGGNASDIMSLTISLSRVKSCHTARCTRGDIMSLTLPRDRSIWVFYKVVDDRLKVGQVFRIFGYREYRYHVNRVVRPHFCVTDVLEFEAF